MFRNLCEGYFCTIGDLENLTLDQLYIMAIEKKMLGGMNLITGSPESMYARGILKERPYPGGLSYVGRMQAAALKKADSGASKRQRRAERRAKMIADKT